MRELRRIYDTAVSVDISAGGLGMLTDYPLEEGHVLTFEDEYKYERHYSEVRYCKMVR